jgi:predicted neutral ceramidase superfamily lipid hydrolase
MAPEDETEKERIDRELIELLNELRVALPGVQVLFAFLLAIPFQQRFEAISAADRRVYFAAVVLTVLSSTFLIAPSAHHRMRFRSKAKAQLLAAASVFAVVGLVFLSLAIAASLYLIAEILYGGTAAAVTAAVLGGFTATVWFVVPLAYRSADPGS